MTEIVDVNYAVVTDELNSGEEPEPEALEVDESDYLDEEADVNPVDLHSMVGAPEILPESYETDYRKQSDATLATIHDLAKARADKEIADAEALEQHRQQAIQDQTEQLKFPLLDRQIVLLRQALQDAANEHDCTPWLKEFLQRRLVRSMTTSAQIVVGLQGGQHEVYSLTYQGQGQFDIKLEPDHAHD